MPDNSSLVIEQEVTSKLEGVLGRIKGVTRIDSRSGNGSGHVTIGLDKHTDIDVARLEAATLVRQMWSSLPPGVSYPSISTRKASDEASFPFMTYTVTAPLSSRDIGRYAEEHVKTALADLPGVANIDIHGVLPMEYRLEYDADHLYSLGISPGDIASAIGRHYGFEFLGLADTDEGSIRVVRTGEGEKGELNIHDIAVNLPDGTPVGIDRLVKMTHREAVPSGYFRINGKNSIYLNVTAEEEANRIELSKLVRRAVKDMEKSAPKGMEFNLVSDSSDNITKELDKIWVRTSLTVLLLLLFIVVATLDIRYSLLIVVSLVINLGVAVIFYRLSGTEIHLYSLAGITISLNLVIDNTIVMCDHYMRRRDLKVFPAILAATLTTIGALTVIFFLDDEVKANLIDFVVVVVVNLVVSLGVALFLVPALAEYSGIKAGRRKRSRFAAAPSRIAMKCYRGYIGFALRFRWIFFLLMAGGIGVTGGLFFTKVSEGVYFTRHEEEKTLIIAASLPNGSTLPQMNALMQEMELFLMGESGIRQFQTNVFSGRNGAIYVRFTDKALKTSYPYKLKSEVISKALTLGGGSWSVSGVDDMGFNNELREESGGTHIILRGFNYDELYSQAERVRDSLLAHRRINDVEIRSDFSLWKDDYSEYKLTIDKMALAEAGISVYDFYNAITPVFGRNIYCGSVASDFGDEGVRLSALQGGEYDVWGLKNMPIRIGDRYFRISDLATFEKGSSPKEIVKESQAYRLCIQYAYVGSWQQGNNFAEKIISSFRQSMPAGYSIERDLSVRGWDTKDYSIYLLLGIVVLVIFLLSAILFNSLLRPLAIIAVIPMSYVGIFLTFWLFDLKFDQGGFASFILLSGITVNAAIYLIYEFDRIRGCIGGRGIQPLRIYLKAFGVKIMPILMTVISTVLGFIPFIVGTSKEGFWFPLAAGTIGGLLFSLIAVVFYLPLMILPRRR